jgi:hypothetical protein
VQEAVGVPGVEIFQRSLLCEGGSLQQLEGGYRRGMLEDLSKIKEAMDEVCREAGMKSFKVVSPVELLGIRPGMDEDALISILGDDPVHMVAQGYAKLEGSCINLAESTMTIFTGRREAGRRESVRRTTWPWKIIIVEGMSGCTAWCREKVAGREARERCRSSWAGREGRRGAGQRVRLEEDTQGLLERLSPERRQARKEVKLILFPIKMISGI